MTIPVWPSGLQDRLNANDFNLTIGENLVRTEMSTGPYKSRKRFTKAMDTISCSILMNRSEYQTFKNFYETSLNSGSREFEYRDPITDEMKKYKFASVPVIRFIQGNTFQVSMNWIEAL